MTTISATKRTDIGRGACKKLRGKGTVPAVIYGEKKENLALSLNLKSITPYLYNRGAVLTLKIDDAQEETVVIKEVQVHPVKDHVLHVDLCRVAR